jgi:hypothetical protein
VEVVNSEGRSSWIARKKNALTNKATNPIFNKATNPIFNTTTTTTTTAAAAPAAPAPAPAPAPASQQSVDLSAELIAFLSQFPFIKPPHSS